MIVYSTIYSPFLTFSSVAVLARNIWRTRPHGERGSASLYWRSGGQSPPAGSRGSSGQEEVCRQNPWSKGQGRSPLKLKHFWLLDVQWKSQICPHFKNLETQRNQIFGYLCKQKIWANAHETRESL